MLRRVGFLVLVCLVGISTGLPTRAAWSTSARTTTTGASTTGASTTTLSAAEFGSRLLTRINVRRTHHGCRTFRLHASLVLAARRHSEAMSASNELSHRLTGEADLGTRITRAGYPNWRMAAENLAWGQAGPRGVFRAWVHSAGHRANLDNCRLHDIGIGIVIRNGRPWVTADFGRRRT